MTFTIDLGTILTSILSGLALAGIVAIFRQLKEMNGSIRELQTWRGSHEKLNDERHAAQITENTSLWQAVQWIREKLSG